MSKSSIDRLREAEIAVTERKKQLSDELSASLSTVHAEAEKEVELAQEKAEKFIAEERSKSEKAAEEYLSEAVSKAKAQADEYCAAAEKNADKAIEIIIAGITGK